MKEENNIPDIVAQAEAETPAEATQAFPAETGTPQKSHKAVIALLAVLLIAIIGVAVWFLLFKQPITNNQATNNTDSSTETPAKSDTPESSSEEETAITDETVISALFKKLLILHHPNVEDYISSAPQSGGYTENKYYSFRDRYAVTEKLYTSGLENKDKLYIVTQYMARQGMFKPLTDYNVPNDFMSKKMGDYCQGSTVGGGCSNASTTAVSEEEVAKVYKDFFGEAPKSFENPTGICGARAYDGEYHIFYSVIPGCGGYDGPPHQAYIEKYATSGSNAYVYARVATIFEHNEMPPVYADFIKEADLASIPEGSIYSRLGAFVESEPLPNVITAENYTDFATYRFVFQKDGDSYYFKTVEKL